MAIELQQVLAWLERLQTTYHEQRAWLTELDAAIGDGDHGINLDRGFTAMLAELQKTPPADIAAAFKSVAMTLIRTVGGASGPLYGTFFLRAGAACQGMASLDGVGLLTALRAGVEGVQQRGHAAAGDKTMLDALLPALEALQQAQAEGLPEGELLRRTAAAAAGGAQGTVPLQARRGRASYLGERSIGHLDPGAASAHLLLQTAADLCA